MIILQIAEALIEFKVSAHRYSTSKSSNSKTMIRLLFQDWISLKILECKMESDLKLLHSSHLLKEIN